MSHRISALFIFIFYIISLPACATKKPVQKSVQRTFILPKIEKTVEKDITFVEKEDEIKPAIKYSISPWFGFKKAACSLTFDDGTLDHYFIAFPELEKRNMKATFFLITKYLKRCLWMDSQIKRRLFSWDQAREMFNSGHEIGSHSKSHKDLTKRGTSIKKELRDSFLKIRKEIPLQKGLTFSWPYWRSNEECEEIAAQYYISARSGTGKMKDNTGKNGADPHSNPINFFAVNSVCMGLGEIDRTWQEDCERVISEGGWFVVCFHGIDDGRVAKEWLGWRAMPISQFREILGFIGDRDFWIAPFGTVSRYIHERDSAVLYLVESSENYFFLLLEDGLDDSIYNQPLSISIKLPVKWDSVLIVQNDRLLRHNNSEDGYIQFDALPDGSEIIIIKN